MSERASASLAPLICSGDMYAAVPIPVPVRVTRAESATLAIPKSVILTTPSGLTSTLEGLISR